ncbi:MAG: restriction endonuclease subunit S [Deltaproteobacteria bacterium]|nr:restriction endonuclease subunit S [Deltaproteobacteria bacterium]
MRKGWPKKKVSEIARHSLGKMLDKTKNKGEPRPYLRNLNVRWFVFDLSDLLEMRFLPEEGDKYTVKKGDLVICEGGYPGRAAIWDQDEPVYFQKALHRVRFREPEHAKWCLYYLHAQDLEGTLKKHFNGAGIQHFTGEALARFEIPLPPLPEQQRIIGILDEVFDGIATAKANAEKNLQNVRALFESHLQSVFTQRGEEWVEGKLGDLCSIARGGSPRPIQKFLTTDPDGINWIKIGDATASGKYIYKTEDRIIPDGAKRSRMVNDGDFLLSNSMSFGRPYIMRTSGCVHDGWLVLSDYDSRLDQDYLYYVLGSGFIFQQFDRLAAGSTVRNLNIELASSVEIPIPPLTHQREIARQFEALSTETQRLATLYERKLASLEALKKSLLHQAFSGQL